MAAYWNTNTSSKWLVKKGINKNFVDTYVAELFLALSQDAINKSPQVIKACSRLTDAKRPKYAGSNELKKGKFLLSSPKLLKTLTKE